MDAREEVEKVVLEHSGGRFEDLTATHRLQGYRGRRPSVARKWRVAALTAVALIIPAAAGLAQDREGEPATALAFTAPDGTRVTLTIQDTADGLCRDLKIGATEVPDDFCLAPARADALAPVTVRAEGLTVVYGTVPRRTRRVDVTVSGRTRLRLTTAAARTYSGRYENVRFWGFAVRGDQVLGSVTLRDRTGPFAATDLERAALPLAGKAVRLARIEDFDREPNELWALAPRVLVKAPTKRKTALCAATRSDIGPLAAAECVIAEDRLQVTYRRGCQDPHTVMFGVGPASIDSATAVLRGGDTVDLDVHPVPRRVGRRGVVIFGEAEGDARVLRVRVFNDDKEEIGSARLRQLDCDPSQEVVGGSSRS